MRTQTAVVKLVAAVALSSFVGLVGCTKKRAEKIAPGQGDNLQSVSEYKGKIFKLTTLNAVDKIESQNITKSKNVDYKSPQYGLDNFAVVNYQTDAKLLGSTKLVARPNTTDKYEIHYIVTNDYVKVMKVAKEEDIILQERTFAETMADGRIAVPLVGYKIQGKYVLDNIQNDIGQKTSLLREKSVVDVKDATHFRIDLSSPEIYKAVQKPDLLPASYFDGEWFFAETVVQAPEHRKDEEGFISESNIGSSTRIKFIKNKDNFEAVSLNLDERLKKQSDINFSRVFTIPVEWKAYRSTELGNSTGMREEENNEILFDKKKYVLVNFEKVVSNMDNGTAEGVLRKILGGNAESSKLVNIEIEDNYLSFTLEKNESNVRFKMSLRRIQKENNYKAKQHFREDWEKFGFFTTTKSSVMNYEIYRKEDLEKNIYISRFNPNADRIEFRFSKTTPAWLRPAVRKAVVAWDDTFCRAYNGVDAQICEQVNKCKLAKIDTDKNNESCSDAGKKAKYLQVTLNEKDGDVDLGDLRYNIINLIESETESNLFGYGPSLTDPYTGEIISATTNVHVTPIRSMLVDEIRNYILMKTGRLNEINMGGRLDLPKDVKVTGEGDKAALNIVGSMSDGLKNIKLPKAVLKFLDPKLQNKVQTNGNFVNLNFTQGNAPFGREFDLAVTSKNIHREIETQCPEITAYVQQLQAVNATHNSKEIEQLNSCSRKLVIGKMSGTLIHEIGHNLGLRHNFTASNDTKNFWPAEKNDGHLVRSSSVMEYPAFNEDRLTKPGLYDVAAIQYGYADKVTATDGTQVQLDVRKTIEQNISSSKLKSYKFCTDEHAYWGIDPMCKRHDAGETPLEVVENTINDYRTSYALYNYRYDRAFGRDGFGIGIGRLRAYYMPLKHFNEQWRIVLADYIGRDKMYLDGMDKEQYDAVVAKLMNDPRVSNESKAFKAASDKAFNFLMSVAEMPNQYCLVQNSFGAFDLVEFEKIRLDSFSNGKNLLGSCVDASDWFKRNSLAPITQLGYPLNDVRFDLRPEKSTETIDIAGNGFDRIMALVALTSRSQASLRSMQIGLNPNFLDIPHHREVMISSALNRLGNGVSVDSIRSVLAQTLKSEDIDTVKKTKSFFKKFDAEKDVISTMLGSVLEGLIIPGKDQENMVRLNAFRISRTSSPTDLKAYAEADKSILVPANGSVLVVNKENKPIAALANTYLSAKQLKNFTSFSKPTMDLFAQAITRLKLPQDAAAADSLTTMDYVKGFQEFMDVINTTKEEGKEEVQLLMSFFPEITQPVKTLTQILSLEQQASIDSLESFAAKMKAEIKAQNPNASDQEIDAGIAQQIEQLKGSGLTPEALAKAAAGAKANLEKIKQQLSQSAAKLAGKNLLTKENLAAYVDSKYKAIQLRVVDSEFNRKEYEAQVDLILGFLMQLSTL